MAATRSTEAFTCVLEAFKKRLSTQELEDFEIASLDDLKACIDSIQREQQQRRCYRNLNKIRPLVNGLQRYERVIEQFVNTKPDFLAFIWGPIKFCLQAASHSIEAFDSLLDAYKQIGARLPMFEAVENLFSSRSGGYVHQILADIYEDILKFHNRAIVFFKQRAWKAAFKIIFQPFGDLLVGVLRNLERSSNLLTQSISMLEFEEAQDARISISREFEKSDAHRKASVTDWLAPVDWDDRQKELRQMRLPYPNTTRWIFGTTQISEWFQGSKSGSPIMWIYGIPGAGKTFIFSSIVDEIVHQPPNSQIVYFYCKYDDPDRRSFGAIVRCLIAQISSLNPICSQYVYDKMVSSINRRSDALCTEILETLIWNHEQLFIGIDGLDECPEPDRRLTLSMIHNILKPPQGSANLKIFLTSRKEKDIDISLKSAHRIDIRPYHLKNDIFNYVQNRMIRLSEIFTFPADCRDKATTEIAKRSHGMFLLSRLILDNLLDQGSQEDFEEELRDDLLPNGIDEAYARILARMQKRSHRDKRWDRAKLALDMLLVAFRPLKKHEIQGIFSIRLEDSSLDFEKRRWRQPLQELLGPMIEVHSDDSVDFIHPTAKESYLLQHHSGNFVVATEAARKMATLCASYLTFSCFNPDMDAITVSKFVMQGCYAFQEYAALNWIDHARMLRNKTELIGNIGHSVSILHSRYQQRSHQGDRDSPVEANEVHESTEGATSNALDECEKALDKVKGDDTNGESRDQLPCLLGQIFDVRKILESIPAGTFRASTLLTEAYGKAPYKCTSRGCARFYQGFHTKSLRDEHLRLHERKYRCTVGKCDYHIIGFPSSGELSRHEEIYHRNATKTFTFSNVKKATLSQSLNKAIDEDDAMAVRNICNEMQKAAVEDNVFLFRAITRKHVNALIVLLDFCEDDQIRHKDIKNRGVLHEAAKSNDIGIVSAILGRFDDINGVDASSHSLFSTALSQGSFDLVKSMLNRSDEISIPPHPNAFEPFVNGFVAAASAGENDIVKRVFEIFARSFPKPLYRLVPPIAQALVDAAGRGNASTVKLLLGFGRELRLERHYPESLRQAIPKGLAEIKRQFQSDVDKFGRTKYNDIARAAQKGDEETVWRLIRAGADVNQKTRSSHALHAASINRKASIVRLLLDHGADVNLQGGKYGTALKAACASGLSETVKILLNGGADVNLRGGEYGTALQAASIHNSSEIVNILFTSDADVNLQGGRHGAALHAATIHESAEIVQTLLANGADVNLQVGGCGSALQLASIKSLFEILKILISSGADINLKGGKYGTALQAASFCYSSEIVKFLISSGADINLQGGEYGTALQAAAYRGSAEIVQILLANGADANLQGGKYGSALQAACNRPSYEGSNYEIVAMLLEYGSNPNSRGGEFFSALKAASALQKADVIQLLLDSGAINDR